MKVFNNTLYSEMAVIVKWIDEKNIDLNKVLNCDNFPDIKLGIVLSHNWNLFSMEKFLNCPVDIRCRRCGSVFPAIYYNKFKCDEMIIKGIIE